MKLFFSLTLFILAMHSAQAGQKIEYKSNGATMEGYLALPKAGKGPLPAVLIVHDWMGLGEDMMKKADEVAALGYVALAVDIYGKGVRPKDPKEAGMLATKYKNDLPALRERITAALNTVTSRKEVNGDRIVVMGYCFGGTTALELGRAGAKLAGIASFHGGLATQKPEEASNIKGKVLVLHGAIDPMVPEKEVLDFQKAMDRANVDYQFISYSGAVHAFTSKRAGSDIKAGHAYNEKADKRSWIAFKDFLNEVAPL